MTIETFAKNNNIKEKRVKGWIEKELIPRADLDRNYVPDSARQPYTKARAKKASSIYLSIVRASNKRFHVLPQLYGICDDEFEGYINQLVAARLIVKRETDEVTYYDAALEVVNLNRKFVLEAIGMISAGIARGTTEAYMDQAAS